MSAAPLDAILDDLRAGLRRRAARRRARNATACGIAVAAVIAVSVAHVPSPAPTLAAGNVGQTDATIVLLHACPPGGALACKSPLQN